MSCGIPDRSRESSDLDSAGTEFIGFVGSIALIGFIYEA